MTAPLVVEDSPIIYGVSEEFLAAFRGLRLAIRQNDKAIMERCDAATWREIGDALFSAEGELRAFDRSAAGQAWPFEG